VWYSVTCSHSDWSRRYKRSHRAHNHDEQAAFVVDAKQDAVTELNRSPKFAGVTANQVGTTSLGDDANDPGDGYRVI
jgi:hypothetical protein